MPSLRDHRVRIISLDNSAIQKRTSITFIECNRHVFVDKIWYENREKHL